MPIFLSSSRVTSVLLDFAIVWHNELCGVIGLGPQHDIYRKTAEIGYWIGNPIGPRA